MVQQRTYHWALGALPVVVIMIVLARASLRTHWQAPALQTPSPLAQQQDEAPLAPVAAPVTLASGGAGRAVRAQDHAVYVRPSTGTARIAELDEGLADEEPEPARRLELLEGARAALQSDPAVDHLQVDCGQTFCRMIIEKPFGAGMDWPAIDSALVAVIKGETVFQTERHGDQTVAYIYTADPDSHLPLAKLSSDRDDRQ